MPAGSSGYGQSSIRSSSGYGRPPRTTPKSSPRSPRKSKSANDMYRRTSPTRKAVGSPRSRDLLESSSGRKVVKTMVGDLEDLKEADWGDEAAQLAKVSGDFADSGDHIRVAVRVRPPNNRELAAGSDVCLHVEAPAGLVLVEGHDEPFAYDCAFATGATQLKVFEALGVDLVACARHGFNASLFAYGQTSSGKSFCMMGVPGTSHVGLIPRIARLLFKSVEADAAQGARDVLVEASYLEIYNVRSPRRVHSLPCARHAPYLRICW